jgi:4-hydroxythreonine-4-phosphate dehydrogenase
MHSENNKPVIGISTGDANGIGLEVIIKTFADARMLEFCTPVIYGSLSLLNYHKKTIEGINFNAHQIREIKEAHPNKVNLINCWQDTIRITLGQPSEETGRFALLSLEAMVNDAREGKLDAIVTAPIDKHTIQSEDFKFAGHTDYLAEAFNKSESLMVMDGEHFRVALVTGHIPVHEIASRITADAVYRKIKLMIQSLIVDFNIRKPKIAVLGLNPHAGDTGLLGTEENEMIMPAIERARKEDLLVFGPYPADGYFGAHTYHNFDATLAMYHDQGLVPFKFANFEKGVNFTAGLPVVRTSPDHGTAYDIAGKNLANEQSFREAVYLACEIVKNRRLYTEVNKNPLKSQMVKEKDRD